MIQQLVEINGGGVDGHFQRTLKAAIRLDSAVRIGQMSHQAAFMKAAECAVDNTATVPANQIEKKKSVQSWNSMFKYGEQSCLRNHQKFQTSKH